MFQYIYPRFQKKRLLRAEMLEQLRDYPRTIVNLILKETADGIVSGCGLTWENEELTVGPGMVSRHGQLYLMNDAQTVPCIAEDRIKYLKIRFGKEQEETGFVAGTGEIILENQKADPSCEMELCRFRLQNGARLRCRYENFEDYSTEYDTVNLIHAPYAAEGKSTMAPGLLKQYAGELLAAGASDVMDVTFAMNILAQDGRVSLDYILLYLERRLNRKPDGRDKKEVYLALLELLKGQGTGNWDGKGKTRQNNREIMLV